MVHLKKVNENSSNIEEANTSIVSEFNLSDEFENEALSFQDLEESNKVRNKFKNALNVDLWRVKKKGLNELCDNSIKHIKNNYKKAKTALKTKFAKAVAPGQSSRLLDILSDDESFPEDTIDENLKTMKSIYDSSDNFGKKLPFQWFHSNF